MRKQGKPLPVNVGAKIIGRLNDQFTVELDGQKELIIRKLWNGKWIVVGRNKATTKRDFDAAVRLAEQEYVEVE